MTRPYQQRQRRDAAEATRRRIIGATARLVLESDTPDVSVDDVAAAAGVSRPTIYRCFGSRGGLLSAAVWDVLAAAGLERVDEARRLANPRSALDAFLRANCRMLGGVGPGLRAAVDLARREPDVAKVIEATYYGRRVESLAELAARLGDAGALLPGWTVDAVVDALMVLTSVDTFEVLTARRGHHAEGAADRLVGMTSAFVARSRRPSARMAS